MAGISADCPKCRAANELSVEDDGDTFVCSSCGETVNKEEALTTGSEPPPPDYLVGEIVGDCKIVAKVGEGGFGSVYKATDQNLQRTVALKVMLQSLTTNAEFVQKFIREAVTAAQLNHPNIVAIHKVDRDQRRGLHYLVMEFVEGRTLADVVKDKGVLTMQEAVPIFVQACDALATAHEHAIVHRDIKPENLMLTNQGVVKITDFGLAKSLNTDHKTTKVMGTPHYMSPEQFEGKAVDGRSDIYSLGVTFYFLLSKTRPYEGQNTVQIIYSILTQSPKPLTEANKDVPPAIWSVIEKMISKRAEDRYQSLRETITDLRKLQVAGGEDRSGCPQCGTKNPKGRKFCRSCGGALVVACPACGSQEAAGSKQCSACGADLDRLVRVQKVLESAKRYQTLGDLKRAAEGYAQVLQLDPTHAEAQAEHARLQTALAEVEQVSAETREMMKTGAIEDALAKVEDLLRRYPASADVRQQRDDLRQALADRKVNRLVEAAEAAGAGGRLREAMESLDQALRIDPAREDVQALRADIGRRVSLAAENRQKAAEALAAGRYEDAYSLATEVLKILPGDQAMEDLRQKARSSVESVDQFLSRAEAHFQAHRYLDALSEYEAALTLRPSDRKLLDLVAKTRQAIAAQRDRLSQARRMIADRDFASALPILDGILAETPDDLESKSLRTACERGIQEAQRTKALEDALAEAGKLENAGRFSEALEQLETVRKLDPDNEVAKTRREQIERRLREETALRGLAEEHLTDGLYADAIESYQRLKSVNPARAKEYDQAIAEAKSRETQVAGALDRAERAISSKQYRRAAESAGQVLALAPKHPRAAAIRKDAEKAVGAIDRFLGECDKLLASEMFDEALEALDKARERGATDEEWKHRRDACDQGRLALLKTDATRSIVMKDYHAAIAAYEHVLETKKDDPEAMRGKRAAERRLMILTQEPLALRAGTAAAFLLILGLVQFSAVAATRELRDNSVAKINEEQQAAAVAKIDETKKEADLAAAVAAETKGDWTAAAAAWRKERAEFPDDARLAEGESFAAAVQAVSAADGALARLARASAARKLIGDSADARARREPAIVALEKAAVDARLAEIASMEGADPGGAIAAYDTLLRLPAAAGSESAKRSAESVSQYLNLTLGAQNLEDAGRWSRAAEAWFKARREAEDIGDAKRASSVTERLDRLRGKWVAEVRAKRAAIPASAEDDAAEQRFYDEVVSELALMARILGVEPARILAEFEERR
ncbi:MAG: Serine/threonine-protein kinase PknD [Planctomycetes bacterium]|nr:Serine/threonine-protein kinase PknD [Planctomycetota bacterium]